MSLDSLIRSVIGIKGNVLDGAPAVTDFDTNLTEATNDHYNGMLLLFVSGACLGQAHVIDDYVGGFKNVSFAASDQWTDIPATGDNFLIIPATGDYLKKIYAALTGATSPFFEQADVAFNIGANLGAQDILNLATANTRYIVRHLRLTCVDPVAQTVTVKLWELVNDVPTLVDSFIINTTNFTTYHSLMDMFGIPYLAGDQLQVTVTASAVGPYAVTGNYSWAKTNV